MKPRDAARAAMARPTWFVSLLALLLAACVNSTFIPPSADDVDPAALARMSTAADRMVVVAVANPSESLPTLAGTTAGGYAAGPGYTAYGSARAMLTGLEKDYQLHEVTAWPIVALRVHCAVLQIKGSQSRDDVVEKLVKDHRVQLAQPLQLFHTLSTALSNDSDYEHLQHSLYEIDAHVAHRTSLGDDVRVAVIDTGIDTTHPDLAGRIMLTRDFVSEDKASFNRDVHGTAVAGVIAANPGNGRGVLGIAPRAKILALKACWTVPAGAGEPYAGASVCNTLTLAQALVAALDSRAQVINLSLSGPPDMLLTRLVELTLKRGAIVVGAVPPNGDLHTFPVGIPRVIAVDLPGSTVVGPVLRAPGRDVLTLTPGGHYDFLSGSSFAAACVSGIAALLLAVDPSLDADHMYAALKKGSVDRMGTPQTVNACGALAAVAGGGCVTPSLSR